MHSLGFSSFLVISVAPPIGNQSYQLKYLPRLMRNNFTKYTNMIKRMIHVSVRDTNKTFTFKQKLFVKNLRTPTVNAFPLCRFQYLLYMEGVMPPNDRSPILVKKIILKIKIFVQNLGSLTVLVFQICKFHNSLYLRQLLLDRLFLSKIFIFNLRLLVQKLGTRIGTVFQIYGFSYLLYMGDATPTIASLPIFI